MSLNSSRYFFKLTFLFSFLFSFIFCFTKFEGNSQIKGTFTFDTIIIKNWPNIHSFSYATYDNYVLMFGGRKDGLHAKESGFEYENSSPVIYLWNTSNDSIINYSADSLNAVLTDFLSAAISNFTQEAESLYIMGGYGQSKSGEYKTHPLFVKIDLKTCIERILLKQNIASSFKYIVADHFAVAGAQMRIMDSLFYLVGGHNFFGKYSSDDHSLIQKYTDALRIFKITETADSLKYELVKEIINDFNFHRRDFNVNPIIDEDGEIKLMSFAGVFQYNINRPFLNTTLIDEQDFEEILDFEHKFASYSCARVGLYDAAENEMYEVFFGGMAEYYLDSTNNIGKDEYVPFVKSVSCVTRKSDGSFVENLHTEQLPGFFGTNSELFINPELKLVYQDIVDLNSFQNDTTFIGTMFGGIYNPTQYRNPWQVDSAHLTISNPYLLKVHYIKDKTSTTKHIQNNSPVADVLLIPNPAKDKLQLIFSKDMEIKKLLITIRNMEGRVIKSFTVNTVANNELMLSTADLVPQNYTVYILINGKMEVRKNLIIQR
jgi:hypothetical protein